LNLKKTIFGVEEGKILGHIIPKDGINIDPERVGNITTFASSQKEGYAIFLWKDQFREEIYT